MRYPAGLQKTRITGISFPIIGGGVSWQTSEADETVARRVLTFLEDRRVLYTPSELEVPEHCAQSVLKTREYLTRELQNLPTDNGLTCSLRAMRAACRKFLETTGDQSGEIIRWSSHSSHRASWTFDRAVGELRGVVGLYVAAIAHQYGIDVEGDLANILPAADEE